MPDSWLQRRPRWAYPFTVLTQSETPAVGAPAPPSRNLTVKDVTDLTIIDTSAHPSPDMHTETHNRVSVNPCDSLNTANTRALCESADHCDLFLLV